MGNSPGSKRLNSPAKVIAAPGAREILILNASDLREILSPAVCLAALEDAYADLHKHPEDRSQSIGFKTRDGKFHVKAGLTPRTHRYFAAKVNANFPENPRQFGSPTIQGLVVLCAADDGRPVAILHSGELTGRRTAAATALAASRCARRDSRTLAIIGCGTQASYQAAALLGLFPLDRIVAFDSEDTKAQSFVFWVQETLGVPAESSSSLADTVRLGDICVTCTPSRRAIVDAGMAPKGCFISAVGADNPDKQEIDPQLFARARLIVDDLEQCSVSGDLAHALRAGAIRTENVAATLAQVVAGAIPGRTHDDEIVLFDSTGTGVQDVAVAAAGYELARHRENRKFCYLDQ